MAFQAIANRKSTAAEDVAFSAPLRHPNAQAAAAAARVARKLESEDASDAPFGGRSAGSSRGRAAAARSAAGVRHIRADDSSARRRYERGVGEDGAAADGTRQLSFQAYDEEDDSYHMQEMFPKVRGASREGGGGGGGSAAAAAAAAGAVGGYDGADPGFDAGDTDEEDDAAALYGAMPTGDSGDSAAGDDVGGDDPAGRAHNAAAAQHSDDPRYAHPGAAPLLHPHPPRRYSGGEGPEQDHHHSPRYGGGGSGGGGGTGPPLAQPPSDRSPRTMGLAHTSAASASSTLAGQAIGGSAAAVGAPGGGTQQPYRGLKAGGGGSFTLAGSNARFYMPHVDMIPKNDGYAGDLEVWPANGTTDGARGPRKPPRAAALIGGGSAARGVTSHTGYFAGFGGGGGDATLNDGSVTARERGPHGARPGVPASTAAAIAAAGQVVAGAASATAPGIGPGLKVRLPTGVGALDGPGVSIGSNAGSTSLAPRPKLLTQLEDFIREELAATGVDKAGPCAARLQVYREAFQFFIEDLRTYKPLLSAIKNEYELLLDKYATRLHYIPPLKARLATMKQETSQVLRSTKRAHAEGTAAMRKQLEEAQARIAELTATLEAATAERNELREENKSALANFNEIRSSNRTLVSALRRHEDLVAQKDVNEGVLEKTVVDLRNAVVRAEGDAETAQAEIDRLTQAMSKMHSVAVSVERDKKIKELSSELADLRGRHATLQAAHGKVSGEAKALSEKCEALDKERDKLSRMVAVRAHKPPPVWLIKLCESLGVSLDPDADKLRRKQDAIASGLARNDANMRALMTSSRDRNRTNQEFLDAKKAAFEEAGLDMDGNPIQMILPPPRPGSRASKASSTGRRSRPSSRGSRASAGSRSRSRSRSRSPSPEAYGRKGDKEGAGGGGHRRRSRTRRRSHSRTSGGEAHGHSSHVRGHGSHHHHHGHASGGHEGGFNFKLDHDKLLQALLEAVEELKSAVKQGAKASATARTQARLAMASAGSGGGAGSLGGSAPTTPKTPGGGGGGAAAGAAAAFGRHAEAEHEAAVASTNVGRTGPFVGAHADRPADFEFDKAIGPLNLLHRKERFFKAMGTDIDVPPYLRASGMIPNRRMHKRAAEALVKEIWIAKHRSSNEGTLAGFLAKFLSQKFADPNEAIEKAYNLVDALRRYEYDADLSMFYLTLKGQLPEAVQSEELMMLRQLRDAFAEADRASNGGTLTRKLSRFAIIKIVESLFPAKPAGSISRLVKALSEDCAAEDVPYASLLEEDAHGDQGKFCEELRDQHLQQFQEFLADIRAAADEFAVDADFDGQPRMLSVAAAREAVAGLDPAKPAEEVEALVARGFGGTVEDLTSLGSEGSVPVEVFKAKVGRGWLARSGRKPV